MTRKLYRWKNNKFEECGTSSIYENPAAAAVIDDTMAPIKHPVTGKTYNSKSAYHKTNKELGLEVVGNDLLSRKPRHIPEVLTEAKIMDAAARAEAIHADPTKRREMENRNNYLYEQQQRLLKR